MDYSGYCRTLLDSNDAIGYVADVNTYELLYMTEAAMQFFCVDGESAWRGRKCYEVLQGQDAPCDFCTDSGKCPRSFQRWTRYVEKIDKWMMFEDYQTLIGDRLCRVGNARDITAEKKRSARLSDSAVIETILLECIRTLSMTEHLELAVHSFLETLGRFYRADRAYILEIDKDGDSFSNTFEWCRKGISSEMDNIQDVPLDVLDALGKDFVGGDGIWLLFADSVPKHLKLYAAMQAQNITELMVTQLTVDGKNVGFLGVDNPRVNLDRKVLLQATADFVMVELNKRRMLRQLEYTSYTDMLTGCYNRNCYIDDLDRIRESGPETFGAMVVDVNGLKRINDLYGHKQGDLLIRRAADVLRETLDENIYRLGGDEFIVLFPDIGEDEFNACVERLKRRFDEESECDVSIGVSWDKGSPNIDKEIFRADERMYERKKSYYRSLLREEQLISTGAARKVRKEIADGLFVVHYQPQVDMTTGKITGLEALVRKKDGEGGLRMPRRFIHFYEAQGMLPYVDIFVLKQVVACIRELGLQEKGIAASVNVSIDTLLLPEFVKQMEVNCKKHGVDPAFLKLEVAHKAISPGNTALLKVLRSLRRAGFRLALDDFGETGSTLDILTEMEFDEIKFSRTMAGGIEQKPQNRIMARNILRLCAEMQGAVHVIEGVENREQAVFFNENGCHVAQGFYFHRPVCMEGLRELIQN
ncbi:MAG: EAL domain-containing protein [Clostridiales bacterium]|nr:EAL domain-containing protein [Clostridiales bacterium]